MEIKVPRLFTITLDEREKKETEVALAAVAVIFD